MPHDRPHLASIAADSGVQFLVMVERRGESHALLRRTRRAVEVGVLIAVASFLFAVAFVFVDQKLGLVAAIVVAVVLAGPFATLVTMPLRGWSWPTRAERMFIRPLLRTSAGRAWVAGALVELVALVAVIIYLSGSGWWLFGAVVVVVLPGAIVCQALWLCDYRDFDLRVLLSWDAWFHPKRVRRQRLLPPP